MAHLTNFSSDFFMKFSQKTPLYFVFTRGCEKKEGGGGGGGNGASLHSAMSDSAGIQEWKSHACAEHVA